jgi:hypothetical protein
MRRLIIFAIVALVGFAPLVVRSISAQTQTWEDYAWRGVTIGQPFSSETESSAEPFQLLADFLGDPKGNQAVGPSSVGARLNQAYPVVFENPTDTNLAFIPEVQGTEFMVVIVESGEFVLDVKGPGSYLVDPVADPGLQSSKDVEKIRIMRAEITDGEDGPEVHYASTDQFVLDEKGVDCTSLCTVLPGVAIQVTDGDRIIAPAGAICIWCLLNQNEHVGESQGQLYVFPLLDAGETFSWSKYDPGSASAAQEATPGSNGYATPEEMTGAAPWALFNPSSNCRG